MHTTCSGSDSCVRVSFHQASSQIMTTLLGALVTILCISAALSREIVKLERCDVPDKALLDEKLDKLFSQLPEEYVVPSTGGDFLIPKAIFLGSTTIRGLDRLEPDRPYKTYCRGQDKVTLFSLRSRYPMRVSIPWRLCSGHNGTVVSHAGTVRYEGELVTSKSVDGGTSSRIENVSTVQLESYDVGFRGAGNTADTAVNIIGHRFSGPVRLYWTEEANRNVRRALSDALEAMQ